MEPIDLNLIRSFIYVHERGGFSAAAERLGVPRSTVSRAVASLEEATDLRLFHRTTRSVAISSAGQAFYERVAPAFRALEASLSELPEQQEEPQGLLRITTTIDIGAVVLAELAARLTLRYPKLQIDARLSNTVVDLVGEGFDLALRVSLKPELPDSAMTAQRVGQIVTRLYAAPSYLARRGSPQKPEDLETHEAVSYGQSVSTLELRQDARKARVTLPARIVSSDMFFVRAATRAGAGIAALPSFLADADVADGSLVRVLPRWSGVPSMLWLVQPSRQHLPRKVAVFRELLLEMLQQRPLS